MTVEPAMASAKLKQAESALPVVIIGAGPAGLTAAWELQKHGQASILLERDIQVGGLARTVRYKGYGFDIGGHRFFTRIDRVERMWHEVLGKDMLRVPRLSRIFYARKFYNYPLKPWNALWGLGIVNSLRVIMSYAHAQWKPLPKEEFFDEYIINRFGRRLYLTFFKTYTEKVWGIPCSEIRADWAAQRIKGLCLKQTIVNAFLGGGAGKAKSLIEEFDYPRLGPGMLWEKLETKLNAEGSPVLTGREVREIHHDGGQITKVVHAAAADPNGPSEELTGSAYFSTMPLRTLLRRMQPPPPDSVLEAAGALRYRDFITVNLILKRDNLFPDNWIYVHSWDVRVGRIQNYGNWSKELVPEPHRTSIGMEYFCFEDDDLWQMKDEDLLELASREIEKLGLAPAAQVVDGFVLRVKKAYPMYNGDYAVHLDVIRKYMAGFSNLYPLGRNGLHKYNNQDHSMLTAFMAVENLFEGDTHDIWQVNSDHEYQEIKEVSTSSKS